MFCLVQSYINDPWSIIWIVGENLTNNKCISVGIQNKNNVLFTGKSRFWWPQKRGSHCWAVGICLCSTEATGWNGSSNFATYPKTAIFDGHSSTQGNVLRNENVMFTSKWCFDVRLRFDYVVCFLALVMIFPRFMKWCCHLMQVSPRYCPFVQTIEHDYLTWKLFRHFCPFVMGILWCPRGIPII